jgi:glucose-6-phosphate dehydrogenase assembly protein OpcA
MTEAASNLRLERLLADALQPIEPPEDLASRVEKTLSGIAEQAAAELASWADELSESELEALRDPRNWLRPVAAVAIGGAAAGALVLVEMRRRKRPDGLRDTAERLLRDLRP